MLSHQAKNVCKYVFPAMLSNVCFFLFSVVDGIFVGQGIGSNALGAVNIVYPIVMVVGALLMLATIGGVTITAVRLGRGDEKGANTAFMHSMLLTLFIGAFFTVIGVFFARPICVLLGAGDTFLKLAADYLFWYSLFTIPSAMSQNLQGFCRNDGSPGLVTVAVVISTLCNIFLDWLFIFPLAMGTAGAALATGISQVVALLIASVHFFRKAGQLRIRIPKPEWKLFKKIVVRGLPEGIAQLATPVMTFCMNLVLAAQIGDVGINAFAVISYVASFTLAVFFGTSEGLQPLFGQSYGAQAEKNLKYYFRSGMIINIVGSIAVIGLIILFGRPICVLFGAEPDVLDYVVKAMPLYAWGFVPMAVNAMISSYLYSTKRSGYAIVLNILRSLVVSVAVILLLPAVLGADSVWLTFGIYELIVAAISVILLKASQKNGLAFK
ncbi:MAG: MATE family efflux transporter [Lachnospiraceae bacterium]|nr:MATE family efflux transporter [Lachnospiraceae bacterium]